MSARYRIAHILRRLESKILYRWLPSWLAVRMLETVCLVRGHRFGQHFTVMFSDQSFEETAWCSNCGKEKRP